jgi:gliding motility-associated-like protein
MYRNLIQNLFIASIFLVTYVGVSQEYTSFTRTYPNGNTFRYQNNIKGDLTFIANNIVNRDGGTSSTEPEDPYDATGSSSTYNDWLNQQYIDIDSDPTTFSSSSANFAFPQASCNLIRYAGLYWSATYPSEQAGQSLGTGRQTDFNQVKLMVPGGAYVDVTADEILFDGYTSTDSSVQQNSPYACYADITALITPLADPTGTYTVANIRSVVGSLSPGGGAAGGWTLIVVYENPTLSGKLITTFDGFARVRSANPTIDIDYSGFNTIPAGPVRANIGAAALEGDNRITGDRMRIRAASNGSFTTLSNAVNPSSNFFNSNITLDGAITTNRTPNSVNTLGYDTDIFLLNNPSNSVIPNAETAATFRFTSSGDQYYPFFNSFNVEIIEPNIVLEKKVEDIAGNDITGQGVNLGQLLDYVLSFQNIGNDDGDVYTIRDVLPINVTLDEANLVLPTGVTYTYDALTRTVVFTIPNNLIEENDPVYAIRMRVQVAENCFDFIDACTDLIENLAYSTYQGVINDNQITDDPSVSDFDNCGFVTPGATNFLLDDLSDCNFTRTVQLCGNDVLLDAGDNFDSYIWYRDENGNNQIDVGTDTLLLNGGPNDDTLVVNAVGTYIVDKIVADPCKGFKEIIIVERFGDNTVNPIIDFYNTVNGDADPTNDIQGEIVSCSVDGDLLPKIFLCGINDSELLQVNIVDAQSIVWEQLDEGSCASSGDDCANKNLTCTWNQVTTGNTYDVNAPGKYRLVVTYQNGCFNRFYFNVFQNTLDILYNKTDIVCTTPGNITITNLGAGYGYQLIDAAANSILVPFSANNGPSFDITTNGAYRVEVVQLDALGDPISGSCIFETPDIGVLLRDFQVTVTPTPVTCNGLGAINLQVLNVNPNYEYELRLDDGSNGGLGTLLDNETAQPDNNFTFNNLNAGDYIAIARTDDGCSYSEQVTITDENDLYLDARVSQHITCKEGNILMDSGGGKTPHTYAIWSFIDDLGVTVTSYPTPGDIPASEYQTSQIFDIFAPGDYTFIVVDRNNCYAVSNTVTIEFRPAADFNATSVIDVLCNGDSTGAIQFNLVSANGYQLTYYLFDATTFDELNYDYANALATNASGNFPGLPAGDYAIVINQRKGSADCDYFEYHTISEPTNAISANAVLIQDYTCLQAGIIEAQNVAGGTAPYEYSLDGVSFVGPGAGSETFSGLTNGSYTITVRDANGCTFVTNPVTIDPLNEPTDLTFTSTQPNCPALTSDVTVAVVDGNAPFTYEITAPAADAVNNGNNPLFAGLAPGTYTFQVTDDKGCTYAEDYTIAGVTPISVAGQLDNNISCLGSTDGGITYTVSGFNTSYDYSVTGPSAFNGTSETANSIPLTGLAAGTYSISVTDNDTNCTATVDVTVAAPAAALTLSTTETQPTCTEDGSVILTASGGWGSNNFGITYPDGTTTAANTTGIFTGLNQNGTYNVSVTDANGCVSTDSFTLSAAVPPVLQVIANSLCYDSATGLTLTANVTSGGTAPFQYRLNGGIYQSNTDFTGLGPGSYTIDVIDSKNCTATANIDVFPTLTATASLVKDLDCTASPDAEISVSITGGNPAFTYEVFRNGASVQVSTAVPSIPFSYFTTTAGTYDFVIADSESCTITTNQVVVTDNIPPAVTEVVTNPLCNTSADGTVELQISGGSAPYQIVFDGSAPSAQVTYTGLVAGTYNYTVTDAKGCSTNDSVTLTDPPALLPGTIDMVQGYRCDNASAILQAINYSGGTPGYEFSIDGVTFQVSDTFSTGITAGTYTITVRDANGCVSNTPAIVIDPLNPPTDLTFAQTAPTCPAIVADVTVTIVDGTAPYVYEIIAPAASILNNGNNNVFTALAPGTYTFRVTDDKGCIIEESYTIADIPQVAAVSQLTNNVSCFGASDGAFNFTVSDFTTTYSYTVENSATTIIQSQNNINLTTPIAVVGLDADTYTVRITDDTTNCTTTAVTTINNPPAALDFTFADTPITCIDNATITVTATDGWGSYEYQLENTVGPAIVYAYQGSNTFVDVPAGTYTIYVRDAGGCIVSKSITLNPAQAPTIAVEPASDFCYDGTNQASLSISITDGVAPYVYSINGGAQNAVVGNPFTVPNLIPGTYNIQVTDAYGCVSNIITETVEPQLSATASLTKALDCTVSPDAIIDVTISDGYLPYASYELSTNAGATWSAPIAVVGNNFSHTAPIAGTYDFRITDNNGCTVITQATVAPIANPVITSVVQTLDILCNGDSGASITVNLDTAQGMAPFTISVVNTTTATNYGTQTAGLPAGTYEVTVIDANSCTDMDTIVISEPDPLNYDINLVPITCNPLSGTDPGSITVENLTGGTAGYTYHLTGNNGYSASQVQPAGADYTFTILEFGIYEVDVVDANGCSLVTTNIIASPPDDLDIDVSAVTADCATGGTAVVTVTTAILGTDYEFGILDSFSAPYASTYFAPDVVSGPTRTFTGLIPGITYTFVVHDNTTNCYYFETAAAPIDSPSSLTSTLDALANITCTGAADGNVSFSFDNYDAGATSVSYEIFNSQSNLTTGITGTSNVNPPAVGTGVSVSNLGPLPTGVYYVMFTEVGGAFNGCTAASAQFNITESTNLLQVTAALDKNDNCNPNAGQVSAVGQFGTAPYGYQITLSTDPAPTALTWTGSATNVFNVDGGDYIIYIKDANNCIQSDSINVPTDSSPEISVTLNDQCTADEGDFSVDITLDVAGIAPYTISIDGATPQAAATLVNAGDILTISNLSSGAHTFTISDLNGCGETENITLYPPLSVLANVTTDENCVPANSGEVTVTASGGSGNYSYSQITPAGPTNATGIFSGLTHSVNYTFEIEDTTTNCTETVIITLPAPAIPTFSLEATDVSCFGGSDGTITVTLNPGNIDVPYEYSLDGGTTRQLSNVFTGLVQGAYNVTVISAKGCQDTIAIDVNEPTQLDVAASASAFSCDDLASTITVTINNDGFGNPSGTGPYTYSFDNGTNFQTGNTYAVAFGSANVDVVVMDANGCTDTVVVPVPVTQEVTAVINQLQAIDCNNGQEIIEIVASNGSGTYTYAALPSGNVVADPANIVLTQPGTYVYEITDTVTNCSVIVEHTVAPYDLIDVSAAVLTDASCSDSSDGVIEVTITGYTGTFDYQVLDNTGGNVVGASGSDNALANPYVFNVATTLAAGTYSVQITETAYPECVGVSNVVTIDAPEPLALLLIDNVNANCNEANAIVTVQATGGTAPYSYGASISGAGVPATFPFDNTVELNPTTSLNWDIYVQGANGCIIAAPLAVTVDTDTSPDITLAIDDECAAEGSFGITVSLDAINTGVAPYAMRINGGAFESISSFPHTYSGLNSGAYTIEIRDSNNCGEIENITIEPELRASAIALTQPTCAANDGVIEFTVNGGSGAFTAILLQSDLTPTGIAPAGNQFTSVPFGDFIVRITDNTLGTPNCIADAPISLEEPSLVTLLTTDWTDVSCTGATDGTITINMAPSSVGVNDNPPYVYEITDGFTITTQSTNVFTGLPAGTYDITVTSNRNCLATDQVIIVEPIALDAAITNVVPFACDVNNSQQAAIIEVTITAGTGTPNYFYSVNGGAFLPTGGNVFTYDALTAGNYDIVIRDANGCLFVLPTQVIDPLNIFTANVTQVAAISCAGPEEVLITVTDNGNPHVYAYELLPLGNPNGALTGTPSSTTAEFDLTAVGSYTFRITDTTTGCYIDTLPYEIAPYDLIEVVATATTPVTCFGDTNGALEIMINGYAGTYDYEVFTQAGASVLSGSANTTANPLSISGLSGGNYFVRVTETAYPDCQEDSNIVTIVSPDMPLTTIVNVLAEPTCTDDQGEILVNPSGGYVLYDIHLTNTTTSQVYTANNVQTMLFTGLAAGNYDIVITDTGGCVVNDNAVLIAATPIVANAIPLVTNLACNDDDNGTVTAVVTGGGSGNYEYQLNIYDNAGTAIVFTSGEQTSDTFTGLVAGVYSITVTDGWNCDVETNQIAITEPTVVTASLIRTDPLTCATGVEFELTATGGSGTYEYSLDNIAFLPMTSNPMGLPETGTLGAGTHQYYVRDAINGCDAIVSNSITEDPIEPLTLLVDTSAAFINCNGDATATIYASAQGGLGNYQYELYVNSVIPANRIAGPQSLGEFSVLAAGTYWVNVTSEDCVTAPQEVIITEPIPLTYTDNIVDVSCFGEGNGSITVSLSGGSGGYQYAISPNLNQFDTVNTFTDLVPGDYTVIAQDMNGCFELLQYTIIEPALLDLSATSTPEICIGEENGTISVNISGGTAPYSTSLNDKNDFVQDRVDFTDLASGSYLLFVVDAQGCETNTIVEVLPGQNLNATVEPIYECTGNTPNNYLLVTLEDPAVANDIMYALDSTNPADMQLTSDFTNIAPGTHSLTIAHANGCVNTVDFEILGFEPLTLELQNNSINEITAIATGGREEYTFYFNNDDNGPDNTYIINHTDTYEVRVVDENGCEVIAFIEMEFIDIEIPNFFTPDGDGNNDSWLPLNIEPYPEILIKIYDRYGRVVEENVVDKDGWDGKYHGADLPTGDYWYVIKLQGENDDREFVGHFTLYR